MPTLNERLEADYKIAMKAGERIRIDTLRLIKASLQRVAIDKRKDVLEDQEVIQVLNQQAKQRRETLEAAKKAGRQDMFTQTTQEIAVLSAYLPQQISQEALKQLIEEAITSVGLNQGQIMKYVMGKSAGGADGNTVSRLVGERLKQGA